MKRSYLMTGLIGIAAISLGISALANDKDGEHGKRHGHMMEMIDTNSDGQISLDEMSQFQNKRFAEMDANQDGQISMEEAQASANKRAAKHAEKLFERADANGDSLVDKSEFETQAQARFTKMDTNQDGVISPDEMHKGHGKHGKDHHKPEKDNAQ